MSTGKQALKRFARAIDRGDLNRLYTVLDEMLEFMVGLDAGMVSGVCVGTPERDDLYGSAAAMARDAFSHLARADRAGATRLLERLPLYLRPRGIDVAEWSSLIPSASGRPRPSLAELAAPLESAIEGLQALAAQTPGCVLRDPASEEQLAAAVRRLGQPLPEDLRALYRFCDGFHLGNSFALVSLYALRTYADAVDDDPEGFMYSNVTGERDDDHIFRMDRLQVFDVLDGSFVSYVRLPSGAGRWIDDDREEPAGFVDHDLAGILMRAIASYSAGEPVSFEPHSARRVRDA